MASDFEAVEKAGSRGADAVLESLITQLRSAKQYHELFEALKMRVRRGLGLPLMYGDSTDNLEPQQRDRLEDGLLAACNEVGMLLLADGRIREGWMYLRPVGDKTAAAVEIAKIPAEQANTDELVEVCLHEGVDVRRGYQLVLDHFGTCNAITTYESSVGRLGRQDQQAAAELLVRHVHAELMKSVQTDITRQEGAAPKETTLQALVADRDWLFGEYSYHIDTTHLASTVRIARVLENKEALELAFDMTAYGRKLAAQFQYKGDEPFAEIYPSHALLLGAMLGRDIDAAVDYFRKKSESLSVQEHGSQPVETYVQLLDRLGRYDEAMDALTQFAEREQRARQVVPLLMELGRKTGNYQRITEFCRQHDDLLGYGTALAASAVGR